MTDPVTPPTPAQVACGDGWMEALEGPFYGHPYAFVPHSCRRALGHENAHQRGLGTCRREWPVLVVQREPSPLQWLPLGEPKG